MFVFRFSLPVYFDQRKIRTMGACATELMVPVDSVIVAPQALGLLPPASDIDISPSGVICILNPISPVLPLSLSHLPWRH